MMMSKADEEALRLSAGRRSMDLSQKQIRKLVEESQGNIVSAVLKGYNMGLLAGYEAGAKE